MNINRWDSLIQECMQSHWPDLDWRLIKCQMRQESAFNPKAVSPCGAIGLLQIMPATGQFLGVSKDKLFDPGENIRAGIIYLKRQYDRFPEIPDHDERLKFALASRNGGRGYIKMKWINTSTNGQPTTIRTSPPSSPATPTEPSSRTCPSRNGVTWNQRSKRKASKSSRNQTQATLTAAHVSILTALPV